MAHQQNERPFWASFALFSWLKPRRDAPDFHKLTGIGLASESIVILRAAKPVAKTIAIRSVSVILNLSTVGAPPFNTIIGVKRLDAILTAAPCAVLAIINIFFKTDGPTTACHLAVAIITLSG